VYWKGNAAGLPVEPDEEPEVVGVHVRHLYGPVGVGLERQGVGLVLRPGRGYRQVVLGKEVLAVEHPKGLDVLGDGIDGTRLSHSILLVYPARELLCHIFHRRAAGRVIKPVHKAEVGSS